MKRARVLGIDTSISEFSPRNKSVATRVWSRREMPTVWRRRSYHNFPFHLNQLSKQASVAWNTFHIQANVERAQMHTPKGSVLSRWNKVSELANTDDLRERTHASIILPHNRSVCHQYTPVHAGFVDRPLTIRHVTYRHSRVHHRHIKQLRIYTYVHFAAQLEDDKQS